MRRTRFRLHRLRQRRPRSCPVWPGQPDDGALGHCRSGRCHRERCRDRPRLHERLRDAEHRISIFLSASASLARPARAQKRGSTTIGRTKDGDADASLGGVMPAVSPALPRRILAEALGTALLLATVVGSGIMADRLAGGNSGLRPAREHDRDRRDAAGAHHDPWTALRRPLQSRRDAGFAGRREFTLARGAALRRWPSSPAASSAPCGAPDVRPCAAADRHDRAQRPSQWLAEAVATFGLLAILGGVRYAPQAIPGWSGS